MISNGDSEKIKVFNFEFDESEKSNFSVNFQKEVKDASADSNDSES